MTQLPPQSDSSSMFATLGDPGSQPSAVESSQYQSTISRRPQPRSKQQRHYDDVIHAGKPSNSIYQSTATRDLRSCGSELNEANDMFVSTFDIDPTDVDPVDMWSKYNVGLYASYAAVGLAIGALTYPVATACYSPGYFNTDLFEDNKLGLSAFCRNMSTISNLPWSFKFFVAVFCDLVWPFGLRRKPYMIFGWLLAFVGLLVIGIGIEDFSHEEYLYAMIITNIGVVIAAVSSDGYAVQLALMGKEGTKARRGWILMTAAIVRFSGSVFTSFLQGFLMNGPELNGDTEIAWNGAWAWGFSLRTFYFINAALILILFIPIVIMKEIPDTRLTAQRRSPVVLAFEVWDMLKSKATFKLNFFSTLLKFSTMTNAAHYLLQVKVVKAPILTQSMEQMLGSLGLVSGIMVFRSKLVHENWRHLVLFTSILRNVASALLWILSIHNVFGLRNGWFMVFTEVSTYFLYAISWRLLGVATIEITRPGIESTCFQLIMTVSNVGGSASSVVAGYLFSLMPNVGVTDQREFDEDNGRTVYTNYTILLAVIGVIACTLAAPHIPVNREMVRAWHRGSSAKTRSLYGKLNVVMCTTFFLYGTFGSLLYFFPSLSCWPVFSDNECPE